MKFKCKYSDNRLKVKVTRKTSLKCVFSNIRSFFAIESFLDLLILLMFLGSLNLFLLLICSVLSKLFS